MPCHATQPTHHFSSVPHFKPGYSFKELLGHDGKVNPATSGVYIVDQGPPLSHDKLPFHAFCTVTEGELVLEDRDKQETLHLKAGDTFMWLKTALSSGARPRAARAHTFTSNPWAIGNISMASIRLVALIHL